MFRAIVLTLIAIVQPFLTLASVAGVDQREALAAAKPTCCCCCCGGEADEPVNADVTPADCVRCCDLVPARAALSLTSVGPAILSPVRCTAVKPSASGGSMSVGALAASTNPCRLVLRPCGVRSRAPSPQRSVLCIWTT